MNKTEIVNVLMPSTNSACVYKKIMQNQKQIHKPNSKIKEFSAQKFKGAFLRNPKYSTT